MGMIIIRQNTLPQLDIAVQDRNDAYDSELSKREPWNYSPKLVLRELSSKRKTKFINSIFDNEEEILNRSYKSKYSFYNKEFKYKNDTIVWNTFSDGVALLDDSEIKVLNEFIDSRSVKTNLHQAFEKLGFLVNEYTDEQEIVKHQIYERSLIRGDVINITIFPTQECNARCFYCFEQNEAHIKMSENTVDNTIKYLSSVLTTDKQVVYQWFGGEPLYAKDVIDKIITEVDRAFNGELKYSSKIVTNASLIDDEMIEKFLTTWNVKKVQLTIDGYGEEHDRRKNYIDGRKKVYEALLKTIETLLSNDIFVVCRINLDKNNFSQLDSILDDLSHFNSSNKFFAHTAALRKAQADHNSNIPNIEDNYFTQKDYRFFYGNVLNKMFEHGLYKSPYNILPMRCRNNCYACSANSVLISSEGKLYKCEQYALDLNNNVGTVETGIVMNKAYFEWDKTGNISEQCSKCKLLPICNGGCRANRLQNRSTISPCTKQSFYLDIIFDWVYKLVKESD